jgi:hypothetical protein
VRIYVPSKVCEFFVDALKSHFLCGICVLVSEAAEKGESLRCRRISQLGVGGRREAVRTALVGWSPKRDVPGQGRFRKDAVAPLTFHAAKFLEIPGDFEGLSWLLVKVRQKEKQVTAF